MRQLMASSVSTSVCADALDPGIDNRLPFSSSRVRPAAKRLDAFSREAAVDGGERHHVLQLLGWPVSSRAA